MKRQAVLIAWATESLLVAILLWKHTGLYDLQVPMLMLLLSPFLVFTHWKLLDGERIDASQRLALFFLTGPSAILCLSLILALTLQIKTVTVLGGHSKEMNRAAMRVPKECIRQWTKDNLEKMKSERLIYALLLVNTCILYGSRVSKVEHPINFAT